MFHTTLLIYRFPKRICSLLCILYVPALLSNKGSFAELAIFIGLMPSFIHSYRKQANSFRNKFSVLGK